MKPLNTVSVSGVKTQWEAVNEQEGGINWGCKGRQRPFLQGPKGYDTVCKADTLFGKQCIN
jgi:hypothetical protein